MKNLKKDLNTVSRELNALVKKTEKLMKAMEKAEKAQAPISKTTKKAPAKKIPKAKTVKKTVAKKSPVKKGAAKITDTDKLINIIKRTKNGVSAQVLAKKTGFNAKKVANIIFRTAKQGKIKRKGKGIYVAA